MSDGPSLETNQEDTAAPYPAMSLVAHTSLPLKCLLLDRCSSANLIVDQTLLSNIHYVNSPLTFYCNAGSTQVYQQGFLGDYPEPVGFNPDGITNILSLHNVAKYYHVSYDTKVRQNLILH